MSSSSSKRNRNNNNQKVTTNIMNMLLLQQQHHHQNNNQDNPNDSSSTNDNIGRSIIEIDESGISSSSSSGVESIEPDSGTKIISTDNSDKSLASIASSVSFAEAYYVLCFAPKKYELMRPPSVLKMPNEFFRCVMYYCDEHEVNEANYTRLHHIFKPQCIVIIEFQAFGIYRLPMRVRQKCLRYESMSDWQPMFAENCAMSSIFDAPKQPFVSIITTAYQSQDRINRVFRSLMSQTYTNWEWIIYDENVRGSEDSEYLRMKVKRFKKEHPYIHYFQPEDHDGRIGYAKRLSFGLAVGTILCEMDHDDELTPNCIEWIVRASEKHPDAGFYYTDCIQMHEFTKDTHDYGDFYAFGYGSDYRVLYRGKYHYVTQTPPITFKTVGHIVGVPNHLRAWRSDVYHSIGGHNIYLSVGDDYDLIVRTFCATRFAHIPEVGYIQYINQGHNNFTYRRNALIQFNVLHSSNHHMEACRKRIEELSLFVRKVNRQVYSEEDFEAPVVKHIGAASDALEARRRNATNIDPDDNPFMPRSDQQWLINYYHCPQLEYRYKPCDEDPRNPCVSIVMPTYNRPEDLRNAMLSVIGQTYDNWELYIIGDGCPVLSEFFERIAPTIVPDVSRMLLKTKIRWMNLTKNHGSGGAVPRNYALKMLVNTRYVAFLDDDNVWLPDHLKNAMECFVSSDGGEEDLAFVFSDFAVGDSIDSAMKAASESAASAGSASGIIKCVEPKKGRIDTSTVVFKSYLLRKYGLWKNREEGGYAHDWELFSRWVAGGERWKSTGRCTMAYSTCYNAQTYESIKAMVS